MTARYTSQDAVEMIVTALNEIEQGKIGIEYLKKVKKPR